MLIVGLTGSIGMGKSYVAERLREMNIPVFDADNIVHELFENPDSPALSGVEKNFPACVVDGVLNRQALGAEVFHNAEKRKQLEAVIHPLVLKEKRRFLTHQRLAKSPLVVLDIPLLYELGWEKYCGAVMVAHAPASIQRRRVLSRPGMTEEKFNAILASQMPSTEKEKRADYVINTGVTRGKVVAQLKKTIAAMIDGKLRERKKP